MRVVFAGGGTGGHVAPGIALAERLGRGYGAEVLFLSVGREVEEKLLGAAGYELVRCSARPLKKSAYGVVAFVLALLAGLWKAVGVIENSEAQCVVGLGGYASVPGVLAAWILGRKVVLLEQNILPGGANKFLGKFAAEIECQWEESVEHFPRRGVFAGNPVRQSVLSATREEGIERFQLDPGKKTLLVVGGSQAAEWLDREMMRAAEVLSHAASRLQVIHIASGQMKANLEREYKEWGIDARVFTFLHEIGMAYAASDLAVSRAGGTAMAELTCFGVPMILVPYPHAAGGHQLLNARAAERAGAAVVVEQERGEGTVGRLITELLWDEARLLRLRGGSLSLGKPDAAQNIARKIADIVEERG